MISQLLTHSSFLLGFSCPSDCFLVQIYTLLQTFWNTEKKKSIHQSDSCEEIPEKMIHDHAQLLLSYTVQDIVFI